MKKEWRTYVSAGEAEMDNGQDRMMKLMIIILQATGPKVGRDQYEL